MQCHERPYSSSPPSPLYALMVSPPKPWERGTPQSTLATTASAPSTTSASTTALPGTNTTSSLNEAPARPPALTNSPAAATNAYNSLSSSYTPYSGYNSYNSYNRFGTNYSPYGGYGGMYGGMGMGYGMNSMGYGMNGMYGGMGMPMDPNAPNLTQTMESTTQQTFAILHSIVQTFTGLSQMLESTFMATHSSFFAMVGVVDQFSNLRNALGSVLGLFGLVRWLKDTITGRKSSRAMHNEFQDFVNGRSTPGQPSPPHPKPSKKPLIIFLLAIFGVPYAMHRLIKVLAANAQPLGPGAPFDPSSLTFARAKYPFKAASPVELSLNENEIVAIMGKLDPRTGLEVDPRTDIDSDWWKGRTREGREGWFPSKWVEILEKRKPELTDATGKSV